ncbi:MAG: cupin domain-containing protein [Alphaproteobacteria bacterium]
MATKAKNPVVNIADVELTDFSNGEAFVAKLAQIGGQIGAKALGVMLTVVPAGKRAFPFHAHYANEEMFFILEGTGEYRIGDTRYKVKAGDILAAPAGDASTAHHIINTGKTEMRYLAFSTTNQPEAVEYPDSGKFLVVAGMDETRHPRSAKLSFLGRSETSLKYWDGETGET